MKSSNKSGLTILIFALILFSCKQQPAPPERTDDPFPGERGEVLDNYARYDMWDTEPEGFRIDAEVRQHRKVDKLVYDPIKLDV